MHPWQNSENPSEKVTSNGSDPLSKSLSVSSVTSSSNASRYLTEGGTAMRLGLKIRPVRAIDLAPPFFLRDHVKCLIFLDH